MSIVYVVSYIKSITYTEVEVFSNKNSAVKHVIAKLTEQIGKILNGTKGPSTNQFTRFLLDVESLICKGKFEEAIGVWNTECYYQRCSDSYLITEKQVKN